MIESLEKDIDKQQKYFKKLFDSAKDKLKRSKINPLTDDHQSCLEEFLKLQSLITHSGNNQKICNYLAERQSQLQQTLTKKKLDSNDLEEIRLAKEKLTKLEIQKSILVVSNDGNQQTRQAQIQVPPRY